MENCYPIKTAQSRFLQGHKNHEKDITISTAEKAHKVDAIAADNRVTYCVYDHGYRKEGELAMNVSGIIVFGKLYPVENHEKAMCICRSLSLKYTQDTEYIESEIQKFGNATLCYELCPEHITGKLVNES